MQRDDLGLILEVMAFRKTWMAVERNAMETLAIASYYPGDKFKHVVVNMRGMNGNALIIVGNVKKALHRAGASHDEVGIFIGNAMANNHEHLLATVVEWVTVVNRVDEPSDDAWSSMMNIIEAKEGSL